MPQIESFATTPLSCFSEPLLDVIQRAPLPGLRDGPAVEEIAEVLQRTDKLQDSLGNLPADQHSLCLSGLWLLAGDLDRSHQISQGIENAEGSFWHGIMHRREGDYGNAKYWFRRVGSHPVIRQLADSCDAYSDPFQFVDACQSAVQQGGDDYQDCQQVQWLEWQRLMTHCICG